MVINAIPLEETKSKELPKSKIRLLTEVSEMITHAKQRMTFYFADLWEANEYSLKIIGKYWGREAEKILTGIMPLQTF